MPTPSSPATFPYLPISTQVPFLPPFSFRYDGQDGHALLASWTRTDEITPAPGGELHRVTFTDPATGLRITAETRLYTGYDAADWVIRFENTGDKDTPLIEAIRPLQMDIAAGEQKCDLRYALGSEVAVNDFENRFQDLPPGGARELSSMNGRSSRNNLPFFNLQVGDAGMIMAIGWTGNWQADFDRTFEGDITLWAGMPVTRFSLHPGESARTPSILLLNWQGDLVAAHNVWRRLLLTHIVPQYDGQPIQVPSFYCVWGTCSTEWHLNKIKELTDAQVPIETYWIDAGWYGDEPLIEKGSVLNTQWGQHRGSWRPSKECYPEGFGPMTKLLKEKEIDFLLWFETEIGDKDTDLLTEHPDWFICLPDHTWGLLNLGNPEARENVTRLISKFIKDNDLDWYRQDFNTDPELHWKQGDTPTRIGLTEIHYVEGLYAFWDALRAEHPHLKIDNCASGGRRIDLETTRRSVPLWRSDCIDILGSQNHTAGLAPWVPLSGGVVIKEDLYQLRSAYSAGLVFEGGMAGPKDFPSDWLKSAHEEFAEVRPYFYGDYYPINPHFYFDAFWIIWQFDRPDLKSGVVIAFLRRLAGGPEGTANLKAINLEKEYLVEIRPTFEKVAPVTMSGQELSSLKFRSDVQPGSVLIFYREK